MLYDPKRWPMPEVIPAKPEVEPWRKLLLGAIEVIERRGWTRGSIEEGKDGPVCALGAMQVARHGTTSARARHKGSLNNYSDKDHEMARRKLSSVIGMTSIARWNDGRSMGFFYGDAPRTDKRDIIAAFKMAAKS
jgi:hypothetical protein